MKTGSDLLAELAAKVAHTGEAWAIVMKVLVGVGLVPRSEVVDMGGDVGEIIVQEPGSKPYVTWLMPDVTLESFRKSQWVEPPAPNKWCLLLSERYAAQLHCAAWLTMLGRSSQAL